MPRILVVDDSPVARKKMGRILAANEDAGYQIEFAENGKLGLEKVAAQTPDLVVTDLFMPELDGLQLVAELHETNPLLPTILVTSQGSEEIAVKALQRGAASYVPKRLLEQELANTVERVLSVSLKQVDRRRLLQRMKHSESAFVLENDPKFIPTLIGYLQEGVAQMGLCDESDLLRIGIALDEALVNALYHGNLEVSSDLRSEGDFGRFYEEARKRREQSPFRERSVHVRASLSTEQAVFDIRDEGPGFDVSSLPDPTSTANLDAVSGRGVMLMRTFMDQVVYNSVGNQVLLTKRSKLAGKQAD